MRAVRVHHNGGIDSMVLDQLPDPVPGPGEVLVRVSGAGVNFIEVYHRTGLYPLELPTVLGAEGAGEVVAVGEGVDASRIGSRVASVNLAGSYAELATVAVDRVATVPDGVDDVTAAGALLQGMTAHYLLHDVYAVRRGETILVHAAAGGMGLLLTQWATRLGVRVIGTASTPEKADLARAAGAVEVLGYDDVAKQVRDLTDGEGVAAVYDGVGRSTFDASLGSLRRHGVLASFGNASGKVDPVDITRLLAAGSVYLIRPSLQHYVVTPGEFAHRAATVFELVQDGELDIRIGDKYPLTEAGRAHDDLENRRTTGKLVLIP
ncbi:MAG TPA: quinone oxidoreductase [Micromonosporaceae bacterium]